MSFVFSSLNLQWSFLTIKLTLTLNSKDNKQLHVEHAWVLVVCLTHLGLLIFILFFLNLVNNFTSSLWMAPLKKKAFGHAWLPGLGYLTSVAYSSIENVKAGWIENSSLSPQREPRVTTKNSSVPHPDWSPVVFVDRYLEKHITPSTLKTNIRQNPLYMDVKSVIEQNETSHPSWTVKDYDTQANHSNLAEYLQVICGKVKRLWKINKVNVCLDTQNSC